MKKLLTELQNGNPTVQARVFIVLAITITIILTVLNLTGVINIRFTDLR